jgi:ADP-ribose pyrophosphatase
METRRKSTLFTGLVFDIEQMEVRLGEKGWHTYQIIRHPGGAAVLPLHEDGSVTLIRQFRPAINRSLLELPAGKLEPGEAPELCGRRELLEETGLMAKALLPLGIYYSSPGVFDEINHLYLATGLEQGEAAPDSHEEIVTVRITLEEALRLCREGGICDGKTMAALLRASGGMS